MAKDKKNPIAKGLVWIVLLLLIVGLAGFGATNFGGSTRVVATVGDTEIDVDRYARALQNELRRLEQQTGRRITMAEARQAGIDTILLQRLIATAALEDEAAELGLSVGDAEVARSVQEMAAFQGIDGSFDREAYRFALENAGLSVAQFEEQLRGETARAILQGALVSGIAPPDTFVNTLYDFAREQRDLTLVRFSQADLEDELPEPTDADLQAYYEANPDDFTLPERKEITYAWLSPEMMTSEVEVSEDAIRELYDARADEYDRPERRLVERLVFTDEDAAQTAKDAIEAGDTTFEALVEERGLEIGDVDLGDVAQDDLGEAGDAVFALDDPGIAGPAPSSLGPALFRVNAILSAQQTPFEDVRDDLRDEAAIAAARRATETQMEPVEDLLAGGATLEEIANETPFELGQTVWAADEAGEDSGVSEEAQAIKEGVRTAAGQGIAADITSAFTSSIETRKGISINQAALNAVLSQFQ